MLLQTQTGMLLHEDHMETISILQKLDEFLGRNRQPPTINDETGTFLTNLSQTLRSEVEGHFGFEEGHLFPAFMQRGEMGIVTMLTHEHRTILPLALQVADLAQAAVPGGFSVGDWANFSQAGAELIEREIFHIQKEEMGLLAAISALLDVDTDASLAQIYRSTMS